MTQSSPLHLTIETPLGPVRVTMPFIVLPGGGDVVVNGQKSLREKLEVEVMAQLKASLMASVLKAHERENDPEMEITAGVVGEPNAGALVRAAMAVTTFGPCGYTPGDVDDDIAQTLLSQRHMMFKDSEVEMQDGVVALTTAVDDAVDHGRPLDCAKMLRDIVFRTHLDVFRRVLLGDPPARTHEAHGRAASQVQGPRGRSRVLLLSCTSLAMRTAGETCCRVG